MKHAYDVNYIYDLSNRVFLTKCHQIVVFITKSELVCPFYYSSINELARCQCRRLSANIVQSLGELNDKDLT